MYDADGLIKRWVVETNHGNFLNQTVIYGIIFTKDRGISNISISTFSKTVSAFCLTQIRLGMKVDPTLIFYTINHGSEQKIKMSNS